MRLETPIYYLGKDNCPFLKAVKWLEELLLPTEAPPFIILSTEKDRAKAIKNVILTKGAIEESLKNMKLPITEDIHDITEYVRIVEKPYIHDWVIDDSLPEYTIAMRSMTPDEHQEYRIKKEFRKLSRLSDELKDAINSMKDLVEPK